MKMLQGTSLGTGAVHERPGNWDRMLHALRTRWIKDYLRDDEGGVCLLGAACVANGTGAVSEISPYVLPMVKVIKEQFPERFETTRSGGTLHTIAYFNNHPETTLEDVLMVVEKAAAESP